MTDLQRNKKMLHALHSIENGSKSPFSLNNLLTNLLNWALQQRNVLPYDPVPINMQAATKEIYALFYQMVTDKGIDLEINIPAETTAFADLNAFISDSI